MKILKILNSKDAGGVYTCECQFIEWWNNQNIVVDSVILGEGNAKKKYQDITRRHFLTSYSINNFAGNLKERLKSIIKSKYISKNIYNELEIENKYDAIVYSREQYLHLAGLLGVKNKTKVYWYMPKPVQSKLGSLYYYFYLNKYKIIPVANSKYTANSLKFLCNKIIYPGFDENRVIKVSHNFREKYNISEQSKVYGIASSFYEGKAQDLFIKAIVDSGILKEGVYCLLAGKTVDKKFYEKCKNLASEYTEKVIFLGNIDDMPKFYSAIDILVNSGRQPEAFGISIAEAMGASKPVIAYDLGGPSEMIEDGYNGWLINKPNIQSYKKTIIKSFENRDLWVEMGKRSKIKSKKFEVSLNARKFLDYIQESE